MTVIVYGILVTGSKARGMAGAAVSMFQAMVQAILLLDSTPEKRYWHGRCLRLGMITAMVVNCLIAAAVVASVAAGAHGR